MIPDDVRRNALRGKHHYIPWVNVEHEDMARAVKAKCLAESPKCDANLGLMPDDTWVVWVRAIPPFAFTR